MKPRTVRAALLVVALAMAATITATAAASPKDGIPINDVVDLTGTTFHAAGCTGGDLTYTSGLEHITGMILPSRTELRAEYDFTAVDSITGESFSGAGSRHQILRGGDSLFHINLRLDGDRGSRIMLTGTLILDPSGQSGRLAHSLDCIHSG